MIIFLGCFLFVAGCAARIGFLLATSRTAEKSPKIEVLVWSFWILVSVYIAGAERKNTPNGLALPDSVLIESRAYRIEGEPIHYGMEWLFVSCIDGKPKLHSSPIKPPVEFQPLHNHGFLELNPLADVVGR